MQKRKEGERHNMKNFIELTGTRNETILININKIEYIEQYKEDEIEKKQNITPFIEIGVNGRYFQVKENLKYIVEEIKKARR